MSRPPPQPPAVTSATSATQATYIPQLPLGTPTEQYLPAPQSQTLPQQQLQPELSQQPGVSNPRKRKAPESASMPGMPAGSTSAYNPSSGYAPLPQQGEQAAEPPAQGSVPKKSRTNTPWSPAEEQRLKTMRDAGNSWSEIAKDMHYADFAEDESAALLAAIKEYEASKWKVIGAKVGKPAKVPQDPSTDW
ncbi:MAG: hypothetical protein LQ338_006539 [Usnochroma carphineum]|nr:MAG: hypothetical protein LQ338_006539 [Usnochroma carphineum]